MNSDKIRRIIACLALLVTFSVIAFAVPFERNSTFYIAYGFGALSIAVQYALFAMAFDMGITTKSKVYGLPIAQLGVIYMIIQLAISVFSMSKAETLESWVVLVVSILAVCVTVLGVVGVDKQREHADKTDKAIADKTKTMKSLTTTAKSLEMLCEDKEVKKIVADLAEKFRFSDPVSNENTIEIENRLSEKLDTLKNAISSKNFDEVVSLCNETVILLEQRNEICKSCK